MKVLILTTIMAPYRVNLFNELGKYCDLTVCFELQQDGSREKDWFVTTSIRFKSIPLKNWHKSINKIKLDILIQIRKNNYDLVVLYEYSTPTSLLLSLYCRANGIPYMVNCDGAFIRPNFIKDFLKRFLISKSSGCLAGSRSARDYFLYYGANQGKIFMHPFTSLYLEEILPNLTTKTEKQVLREKYKISGYSRIAIAAGRFIRSKRFDLAINAWAILPSDWLLVIAGSGELENEYKALVTNLGLKNVQFPGHLETSKLKEMYHFSDIFILPTEFDVWGLVVNEALASGLPVITTEMCIAGNELIIDNVNGYLFKDGNLQQLINSVLKLMMDENRLNLFSINALLSIKNHTFENVASAHLNAFRQVLSSAC